MISEVTFQAQLLNRLRMRQVSLLLAIEEHGTLHAASAVLGMTQPSASKVLRELEEATGHTLFDRVGRGLIINDEGRCVLDYFRGMRGTIIALSKELQALRKGSIGKLNLGSIMAASPAHLTHALIKLKERYPFLSVEITVGTSDQLIELLQDGALDLVIGRLTSQLVDNFEFSPISHEPLSVVVATTHPLVGTPKVKFSALLDYPWILQPEGSPMRDVIEHEFKTHQASLPKGLFETSSVLTTTNLLGQTNMIAVIPKSIAIQYQKHGLLSILPYIIDHKLDAFGRIFRLDRPLNKVAKVFMGFLHEHVGEE